MRLGFKMAGLHGEGTETQRLAMSCSLLTPGKRALGTHHGQQPQKSGKRQIWLVDGLLVVQ